MPPPESAWSNEDPRNVLAGRNYARIVIIRPMGHGEWQSCVANVHMKHGWDIFHSFPDTLPYVDTWDPLWWWTLAPEVVKS